MYRDIYTRDKTIRHLSLQPRDVDSGRKVPIPFPSLLGRVISDKIAPWGIYGHIYMDGANRYKFVPASDDQFEGYLDKWKGVNVEFREEEEE